MPNGMRIGNSSSHQGLVTSKRLYATIHGLLCACIQKARYCNTYDSHLRAMAKCL